MINEDSLKPIKETKEFKEMSDEEKIICIEDMNKSERFVNLAQEIFIEIFNDEPDYEKIKELGDVEGFILITIYENGYRRISPETFSASKLLIALQKEIDLIMKAKLISALTGKRDMKGFDL